MTSFEREREVVRALIVTPEDEILLVRVVLSDRSFWITPGGGIEGREEARAALERELLEETGREGWDIGPEVWTRRHTFDFEGESITQHERFFLVSSERFEPPAEMPDEIERRIVDRFRWWRLDEIADSTEDFAPRRLGRFLEPLLDGETPNPAIDVGV